MEVNWNTVAAIGTLIAAGFAYRAVAVARDGVLATRDAVLEARNAVVEARKARRAEIFLQLSEDYTRMHDSLRFLGARRASYNTIDEMKAGYVTAVKPIGSKTSDVDWNEARRRASKFFLKARLLSDAGLFEPALLAKTLEKAAFDLYVDVVGHLDEVHNHGVLERDDFDDSTWRFFQAFRRDQFGIPS